ncbi:ARM REPEAT PROTEIN INTERACTING WITH ABF2-like [Folsomia candida]|uniref:ARM REPEAT PROTEIN INTERACTING WITH ABF2-like n=1 Tax=Folsomia candida TaxID=158441 RepID=UPI001604E2AB|nr:ARM REPEAT PROTEIN INTERACTING WITH ABF2-like [Folsomia candida]
MNYISVSFAEIKIGPFVASELGVQSACRFSQITTITRQPQQPFGYIVANSSQQMFTLRIEVGLRVEGFIVKKKGSAVPKATMRVLLENRHKNSDISFQMQDGHKVQAHRYILSAQSDVFEAMFATDMMEKNDGEVELTDFSGEGFEIFLKFVYTGELDEMWRNYVDDVVRAADKYNIIPLQELCDLRLPTLVTRENFDEGLVFFKWSDSATLIVSVSKIGQTPPP